ncbi:MAG: hypothetical protein ACQEP5_07940 [Actinomycetota bacterium]
MSYSISAKSLGYRELNKKIKDIIGGSKSPVSLEIKEVCGHRYIGDGIKADASILVHGVPGNDLGAFMDGPGIEVYGNVQDGTGNTMNAGRIIIHGDAGDILGYSMRGGEIYVKGSVGYRSGIHMKAFKDKVPVIVIGGQAGNFLGEYMAGGIIILLGLFKESRHLELPLGLNGELAGNYIGTGMHGGTIYIRGAVSSYKLGKEVKKMPMDAGDQKLLERYLQNYSTYFGYNRHIDTKGFTKLIPFSHRPYGKLYAY